MAAQYSPRALRSFFINDEISQLTLAVFIQTATMCYLLMLTGYDKVRHLDKLCYPWKDCKIDWASIFPMVTIPISLILILLIFPSFLFYIVNHMNVGSITNQIQEETHKLTNNYLDFVYGLKYDYSKRISCFVRAKYSFKSINSLNNNLENINALESLQFFPNQVSVGVAYKLKKK